MADSSASGPRRPRPFPLSDDIARAEKFTRERFVHPGEEAADALAPGSGRRHALDDAWPRSTAGAKVPSTECARRYSLCSGSSACCPRTSRDWRTARCSTPTRSTRCSGTLTALLAAEQNGASAAAARSTGAPVLAVDDDEEDEEDEGEEQPDYDPESPGGPR